jgi:hypothetical protein
MWEDISYCWVVTCKNHIYHVPLNFIYKHKIPLAEADAVTSRPLSTDLSESDAICVARNTSINHPRYSESKKNFPRVSFLIHCFVGTHETDNDEAAAQGMAEG